MSPCSVCPVRPVVLNARTSRLVPLRLASNDGRDDQLLRRVGFCAAHDRPGRQREPTALHAATGRGCGPGIRRTTNLEVVVTNSIDGVPEKGYCGAQRVRRRGHGVDHGDRQRVLSAVQHHVCALAGRRDDDPDLLEEDRETTHLLDEGGQTGAYVSERGGGTSVRGRRCRRSGRCRFGVRWRDQRRLAGDYLLQYVTDGLDHGLPVGRIAEKLLQPPDRIARRANEVATVESLVVPLHEQRALDRGTPPLSRRHQITVNRPIDTTPPLQ